MEFINSTRMQAGYTMGLEASGRELLVVVIKGTFSISHAGTGGQLTLHEEQVPLVMADIHTGEPGVSAPLYEVDFAPCKPRCDILLNASAHAPNGRPATRVEVGIQIGSWSKRLAVVGSRQWDCAFGAIRSTLPTPFVTLPISYDVAFGGTDLLHEDPAQHAAFMPNPVGRGFHKHLRKAWVDGTPLPLTEELGRRITDTTSDYRPMSFGPVGRGWDPRSRFAGTYDDDWLQNHFPFLPHDFDTQYFQAAPVDQQVPLGFFDGGAEVVLTHLTPQDVTRFSVPHIVAPVSVFPKNGRRENHNAALDTLLIEPDEQRFCMTWRIARPLKHNLFEIARVQVGANGRESCRDSEVAFPAVAPSALTA